MSYFYENMMNCMNNMNSMNNINISNINFSQNNILNSSLISDIKDPSFINSTLQAFSSITCIKTWITNLSKNTLFNFQNLKLTKELCNLFYLFYNGAFPDSTDFILNFLNKVKILQKNKVENAIEFLYHLIQIIHYENNSPSNPNQNWNSLNNLTTLQKINDDYVRNFFLTLYKQTQNSIISENFHSIIRQEIVCKNCSTIYSYYFKYMIKFLINDYIKYRNECRPEKSNFVLTLDECFECYTGGYPHKCETCGNTNANSYNSFYMFPKVLVIALIRTKHNYFCDLDFTNNLNVNAYYIKGIYNNMNYSLKACVSLNPQGQYLCFINTNNIWLKHFGKQVFPLNDINTELKTFEPQLLIYELNEYNNNNFNNNMFQMQMGANINMMGMNMNMNFMQNMNFGNNFQ